MFVVTGQIRTVPSTAGDASSPFSLGEQHSMEVGVLAEAAASKAVRAFCSHGSKRSSNQDQLTESVRVAFVRSCINQLDNQVV